MTFMWPLALWSFALLALLPLGYTWLLRRKKRALKFANLGLVKEAVAGRASLRRHLPPILMFASLLLMTFALARPAAVVTLPSERATIVLAIDVSASMRAQDVEPNRMAAAQEAARDFISNQPRAVRIGLVAFSSNAMVAQVPSLSREDVLAAVDRLHPQRYTAVGSGIIASLQAIFPELEAEFSMSSLSRNAREAALGTKRAPKEPNATQPPPVPPGSFTSAVVILLSDGQTNAGIPPIDAAQIAADRGVRIFTVGFGTPGGGLVDFGGGTMRVQLDEEALKAVADITHAKYFNARNTADLKEVYKTLSAQFVAETKRTELTALVAVPALLLLLLGTVLSLLWSNRML